MPHVGRIRHIPMWEYGWQPPSSFTERCPDGVECCVNHEAEWNYALELPWKRVKCQVVPTLAARARRGLFGKWCMSIGVVKHHGPVG